MGRIFYLAAFIFTLLLPGLSHAEYRVETFFPYSLTGEAAKAAPAGSTQLLFIAIENYNNDEEVPVRVQIKVPEGLRFLSDTVSQGEADNIAVADKVLPAHYGQTFLAIPIALPDTFPEGTEAVEVSVFGGGTRVVKDISFSVAPREAKEASGDGAKHVTWYIQGVSFPVDEKGNRDARQEKNTLLVRDVTLENIWHRLFGGGIDWSSELSKPAGWLLLDLRNPEGSQLPLKVLIQLVDKNTGALVPGLISARQEEEGAGGPGEEEIGTAAVIGLTGDIMQTSVIPLYVDPFIISEGEYSLRVTLSDGTRDRIQELPASVVKSRSFGIGAALFASACLCGVLLSFGLLRRCVHRLGARGDISVALFAALAFGGVVVPVTLIGDFLQVILGPFSGLVTGLLSGVIQYILLMALLVLFRKPGAAALFFIIKWLLSAILFGRVSPVGILMCAVSVVTIECVLRLSGFFGKRELSHSYCLFISLLMGLCDSFITLINMEQIMFFYRLYYADWFIGLYMLINGLIYSSIGSICGFSIGARLRQVVSE